MTPVGALRTHAVIEAASESETALGGRTLSWSGVGSLWLAMGARQVAEAAPTAPGVSRETSAPERLRERCTAEARDHPQALRGRRLSLGAEHWRIWGSEPGEPGRVRLHLIRE